MGLVHHHLLIQGASRRVFGANALHELEDFLLELVTSLDMRVLIPPQVALSKRNAYTGLIGIVTSHISFHYWVDHGQLQLDIYSCKEFDRDAAIRLISGFWGMDEPKALFIDREMGSGFRVEGNH